MCSVQVFLLDAGLTVSSIVASQCGGGPARRRDVDPVAIRGALHRRARGDGAVVGVGVQVAIRRQAWSAEVGAGARQGNPRASRVLPRRLHRHGLVGLQNAVTAEGDRVHDQSRRRRPGTDDVERDVVHVEVRPVEVGRRGLRVEKLDRVHRAVGKRGQVDRVQRVLAFRRRRLQEGLLRHAVDLHVERVGERARDGADLQIKVELYRRTGRRERDGLLDIGDLDDTVIDIVASEPRPGIAGSRNPTILAVGQQMVAQRRPRRGVSAGEVGGVHDGVVGIGQGRRVRGLEAAVGPDAPVHAHGDRAGGRGGAVRNRRRRTSSRAARKRRHQRERHRSAPKEGHRRPARRANCDQTLSASGNSRHAKAPFFGMYPPQPSLSVPPGRLKDTTASTAAASRGSGKMVSARRSSAFRSAQKRRSRSYEGPRKKLVRAVSKPRTGAARRSSSGRPPSRRGWQGRSGSSAAGPCQQPVVINSL